MKKSIQYAAVLLAPVLSTPSLMAQRPLGIDVSSYQGSINWTSVYGSGVRFAFARATSGNASTDAYYSINMTHGKAAGVLMGAYGDADPSTAIPAAVASYFWNAAGAQVKADSKTIMPAIDVTDYRGVDGASSYTDWVNDWSKDIIADGHAAGFTLHPILYVSDCNLCNYNTTLTLQLWVSNFNGQNFNTGNPWGPCMTCIWWGGNAWAFWQAGTGVIPGISGPVDLDVFNGTYATLVSTEVVK